MRKRRTIVLNRETTRVIRRIKDTAGEYIWQPATEPGEPDTVLGYPIVIDDAGCGCSGDDVALHHGWYRCTPESRALLAQERKRLEAEEHHAQ